MKTYWARALVLASGLALLLGLGLPLRATAWDDDDRDREGKEHRGREPEACEKSTFPATGQTTPYTADTLAGPGTPVPDDGTVRAGGRLRYHDNRDGTITDRNTGLMWEKKIYDSSHASDTYLCQTSGASLHDVCRKFPWSVPFQQQATIWDWLADVNKEGRNHKGFAGHKDWRIPNLKELQSIVDYEVRDVNGLAVSPAVAPAFNNGFDPNNPVACTVRNCSVTLSSEYWSSTAYSFFDSGAWVVIFDSAFVQPVDKISALSVRAVRGGCLARAKTKEEEKENEKAKEKEKDWSSSSSHR